MEKNNAKKSLKWAKIGLNLPKKITLKSKKVDKGGGGWSSVDKKSR